MLRLFLLNLLTYSMLWHGVGVVAAELKLATFRAYITPPLGEGACIGFMPKVEKIEHPLEARGIVLFAGDDRFVLCALDFQGLCNSTDDLFRERIARAVGTIPGRVAVQSLHQHTAPALDADAAKLLYAENDPRRMAHLHFADEISARVAKAVAAAARNPQPVTHVAATRAEVVRVASNRRIPQPDGTLLVRGSSTKDQALHDAPEGLIDPWLRTITFFQNKTPLAQLHYYATHPQSFYGDARISWDVPGIARELMQQHCGVPQIYFTGCGGNVAMGKYNDGTSAARVALSNRLFDAMTRSGDDPRKQARRDRTSEGCLVDVDSLAAGEIAWDTAPLKFSPRDDGEFAESRRAELLKPDVQFSTRLKAAMSFAWADRLKSGHAVSVSRLKIGSIQIVNLPGEPFVEFQLLAQELAPESFVCVAGYGECGVWYFGPDSIFTDRGGYEQSWSLTRPCEQDVGDVLKRLLKN